MAPTKCIEMVQTGTVCWSPGIRWTLNHRLRFTRQVRNPKRSLPAFNARLRDVDPITHTFPLAVLMDDSTCRCVSLLVPNGLRRSLEVERRHLEAPHYWH